MNRNSRPLVFRFDSAGAITLLLAGVLVVGCGEPDPVESPTVTPPEREVLETEEPESTTPPGSLELPPGDIPNATGDSESSAKEGGLEMPAVPAPQSGANLDPVRYGTWEEIEQAVTSSGRVTVVDLWSLSCEPCLKEFPGLVRLHKTFGDSVQCVSVDIDFDGRKTRPPEHYEERVQAFLKDVGAEFTTYISRTPSDDVYAATQLDSIPAVLIYGKDGKIVQVFADSGDTIGFTYDKDVIPLVTKIAG